jgi:riboflavin synthase
LRGFITEKGSIAVDGISLTVAAQTEETFSAAVIPHTAGATNLSLLKSGDAVNIEVDVIARYIQRLMTFEESGKHILDLLSELKV